MTPSLRAAAYAGLVVVFISLVAPQTASAEDWAYFRGPNHNGISNEAGWNAANPQKSWDKQLGPGCSSVAVVGNHVFASGYSGGNDVVYCLDANNGNEIWTSTYRADKWANMHDGGPGSTPTVADGRVYVVSRNGELICLDAKTGNNIWTKHLAKEHGLQPPKWGFTGSVLPYEGNIYVDLGKIFAFNAKTGAQLWVTQDYGEAYSTPTPFELGRIPALAVFPESGLVILRRDNGKHGGQYDWETSYGVHAATPLIIDQPGDNKLVFFASGYNVGGALVRLGGGRIDKVYTTREMKAQMATPVIHDGYVYGFDDAELKCLKLDTGDRQWNVRGMGRGGGALTMADGQLIVLNANGELMIGEASPKGFNPTFKQRVVSGTTWVMPVLANGRIYAKNNAGQLVCFDASR